LEKATLEEWIKVGIVLCLPPLISFTLWLLTLRIGSIYISEWFIIRPEIFKWATIFWVTGVIISLALSYFQPHLERISRPLEEKVRGKEIYIMLGLFAFLTFFGLIICFKVEEVTYGVVYSWEDYMKIPVITLILTGLVGFAHKISEKGVRGHGEEETE